jgi:pimeloyl-ACP methyl ester carboxylesterase
VQIPTPDGRTLRVDEAGDPSGPAILVCNGTPGGALIYPPVAEDAARRGARVLSCARPGYAGSSPHPGRTVADVARDVEAIADALALESLVVWGASGGGPHALACAALLGGRVTAVASLASVAPLDADGLDWLAGMGEDNEAEFAAARRGTEALRPMLEQWARGMLGADAEAQADQIRSLLSPVDADALRGELAEFFAAAGRTRSARASRAGWRTTSPSSRRGASSSEPSTYPSCCGTAPRIGSSRPPTASGWRGGFPTSRRTSPPRTAI